MRILDKAVGQDKVFSSGWHSAGNVAEPAGGEIVDTEARTAIAGLIAALSSAGILPRM